MNRARIIAALLWGAICVETVACGQPPANSPVESTQGTTQIYAENLVAGPVDLQLVSADIDGAQVGGLQGHDLGRGGSAPLHIATIRLTEGSHVLTVHVRASHKNSADVLVLSAMQPFVVGREPVSLIARLSAPPAGSDRASVQVEFAADGGTLGGPTQPDSEPASCHAMTPDNTEVCVTEAQLRDAIAEHDAPRVVCIDDALTQMRRLVQFSESATPTASAHEAATKKDISFRIAELGLRARRCPSSKEVSTLLDTAETD